MKFLLYSGGKKISDEIVFNQVNTKEIGIFETLRVYNGRIFREEDHLARLYESAKTVGYSTAMDRSRLQKELRFAIRAYGHLEGVVRLTVIENQIWIMIGERKHAEVLYREGVSLRTSPVKRSLTNAAAPEAKTTAYQNAILATLELRSKETYEWVFLDREGLVTEVRIGNLFVIKRGHGAHAPILATPPVLGILNGVTRRLVIECASQVGISVNEAPLMRHDIYTAHEAFLTNTSWELLPVRELDGRKIGAKMPGPWTTKLHQAFKQKVNQECRI